MWQEGPIRVMSTDGTLLSIEALIGDAPIPTQLEHSSISTTVLTVDTPKRKASNCEICMVPSHVSSRTCPNCLTQACRVCFAHWIETKISNGNVNRLTCTSCTQSVTPEEVSKYCGEKVYLKFLYLQSKWEHQNNPYAVWCPNNDCRRLLLDQRLTEQQKQEGSVDCPDCDTAVCSDCLNEIHPGESCSMPSSTICIRVRDHLWRALHTKKCPVCSVSIERAGGCDQMRCTNCDAKFCWKCRGLLFRPSANMEIADGQYLCICPRVNHTLFQISRVGGAVICLPFAAAALMLAGPPSALYFTFLPKEKKKHVRDVVSCYTRRFR